MKDDKPIRVLVVDDERRFRHTISATLAKRGFEVKAVGRGGDAIKEVWREEFDVVVLDIKMPGMNGHEALRHIKAIRPNVQVIMLTGHGSVNSALEGWRDHVFTYLTKPCDVDTLAEMISCAFANKKRVKDSQPLSSVSLEKMDHT